jgi:hypothetical protein
MSRAKTRSHWKARRSRMSSLMASALIAVVRGADRTEEVGDER